MTIQILQLQIELLSGASPGRGDGVAGLVDMEVEHEADTGLPMIKARTVKGLLAEECANIMYSLSCDKNNSLNDLESAANAVFGNPGSFLSGDAQASIGAARLHEDLRAAIKWTMYMDAKKSSSTEFTLTPSSVLNSITSVRRQTSIDDSTGCSQEGSLRSVRTLLPGLLFYAPIKFLSPPSEAMCALLAASAMGVRQLGSSRNRGRGACRCVMLDADYKNVSSVHLDKFKKLVRG